jgi:hypothetical protein
VERTDLKIRDVKKNIIIDDYIKKDNKKEE